MNTMNLVAGLDIGNGYVKGAINLRENLKNKPQSIDFPSGVARIIYPKDIKTEVSEAGYVIDDIFNQMDVSFGSNLVKDTTRRLFGARGLASGSTLEEFDVDSVQSKAQQDLSGILVLGCIAGQALKEYWDKTGELPKETIPVHTRVALALPINEFMHYRKQYAANFKNGSHMVTFYNFTVPVNVEIVFDDVQVLAEGASAQYAINAKGKPLMDAMLADVRRLGESLDGITADDILAATNTVGIDIGEGTVNFPVFQNGKFNSDASLTFDRGYSSVLNNALEVLGPIFMFKNRKQLADFLQKQPNAITRNKWNKCWEEVNKQAYSFSMEISEYFSRVMRRVGASTEVIYIYGGGASALKETLHPLILKEVKGFGGEGMSYPVLYLDSRYSRHLNREGLYIVAEKLAER